jgi:NAD(P)-dependent dehydrogenase (short-subunit alcohol dehydrogenase family)
MSERVAIVTGAGGELGRSTAEKLAAAGFTVVGVDRSEERLKELFTSVQKVGHVDHPYSMPYNHFDVFYCRGMHPPLGELWPQLKKWD